MRHLKITIIILASLVVTVLLGLSGCGEDEHRDHFRGDRQEVRYQRQDNDRHEERQEVQRHEERHD
jgi:hypothetical protein